MINLYKIPITRFCLMILSGFIFFVTTVAAEEHPDLYRQLETPRRQPRGMQTVHYDDMTNYAPLGDRKVSVKVLDTVTGDPVASCKVYASHIKVTNENGQLYAGLWGICNTSGMVEFTLYPHLYRITTNARGYEDFEELVDVGKVTETVVLKITPAKGKISGHVVDEVTKDALSHVYIRMHPYEPIWEDKTTSDKQGFFSFSEVRQQNQYYVNIHFEKRGYVTKEIQFSPEQVRTGQLGDVALTPTAEMKGILTRADGNILSNTPIYLLSERVYEDWKNTKFDPNEMKFSLYAKKEITDASGHFLMQEITPGLYVFLFGEGQNNTLKIQFQPAEKRKIGLIQK